MGPLRRRSVPLLLLLAAACGGAGPGPDGVLSAAGGATEEAPATTTTSTSTTAAPAPTTTTTRRPAPATTTPPATVASTRATRVPVTPSPPIAGYAPAPPPPGVDADGYGGYGGVTTAAAGGVELDLSVYPREQYFGERVQIAAQVSKPDSVAITSVKIDLGNGQVIDGAPGLGWSCGPSTYHAGAGTGGYVYPAPGTYRITATVTFATCMGVPGTWVGPYLPPPAGLQGPWFPEPSQAVSAGMGLLQRPDPPPRPVGPPPGP